MSTSCAHVSVGPYSSMLSLWDSSAGLLALGPFKQHLIMSFWHQPQPLSCSLRSSLIGGGEEMGGGASGWWGGGWVYRGMTRVSKPSLLFIVCETNAA